MSVENKTQIDCYSSAQLLLKQVSNHMYRSVYSTYKDCYVFFYDMLMQADSQKFEADIHASKSEWVKASSCMKDAANYVNMAINKLDNNVTVCRYLIMYILNYIYFFLKGRF